jgi:hypothetical protein
MNFLVQYCKFLLSFFLSPATYSVTLTNRNDIFDLRHNIRCLREEIATHNKLKILTVIHGRGCHRLRLSPSEMKSVQTTSCSGPIPVQISDRSVNFLNFFLLFSYDNIQNFYSVSTSSRKGYMRSI